MGDRDLDSLDKESEMPLKTLLDTYRRTGGQTICVALRFCDYLLCSAIEARFDFMGHGYGLHIVEP